LRLKRGIIAEKKRRQSQTLPGSRSANGGEEEGGSGPHKKGGGVQDEYHNTIADNLAITGGGKVCRSGPLRKGFL